MTVELKKNDDGRVTSAQIDGATVARFSGDDEILEQNDMTMSVKTTARSAGNVVGNPIYEVLLEVPTDRASVLSMLDRSNAQARTNAVNEARRPEGLDNDLKKLLRELKANDPEAIEALKRELQSRKSAAATPDDEAPDEG